MANRDSDRELPPDDGDVKGNVQPDTTGRADSVEPGPEDRLMQLDTIDVPDPANPDDRSRGQDIDDRAADAARMAVRRREHSAD
jgi:hypothetical protein